MKRALLATWILATGASVFCAFHSANTGLREELATQLSAWQTQTQQLAQLHFEKQQIVERVSETKQMLAAQPSVPAHQQLAEKILSGDSLQNLSVAEREALLTALDFNWNTTGDYLIISKKSLDGISLDGMKGSKLTAAARAVLAITPAEQNAIETMTQQLGEERKTWATAHIQRTEPSGDVLAQYALPVDENLSRSQHQAFTNILRGALGQQRSLLLQLYSYRWMQDAGLFTESDYRSMFSMQTLAGEAAIKKRTTLKVERYPSGNETRLNYTLEQAVGGSMTTEISPWQPFPETFKVVFPGGWKQLAEREGFALPEEFRTNEAR
jgi:hypothetical protein